MAYQLDNFAPLKQAVLAWDFLERSESAFRCGLLSKGTFTNLKVEWELQDIVERRENPHERSEISQSGRSKRRRTQKHASERKRAQAQKGAKGRTKRRR